MRIRIYIYIYICATYTHTGRQYGEGRVIREVTTVITAWIQMENEERSGMILSKRRFFNRIFGFRI